MTRKLGIYGEPLDKTRHTITLHFSPEEWKKIQAYRHRKSYMYFLEYDFLKSAIMEIVK